MCKGFVKITRRIYEEKQYKRGGEPKLIGQVIRELFAEGHILTWLGKEDECEDDFTKN